MIAEELTAPTTEPRTGVVVLTGLVGAAIGAVVGYGVDKNIGGLIGGVVTGAAFGGIAYSLTEDYQPSIPPNGWRILTLSDIVQPGQQVAVTIVAPSGVPLEKINAVLMLLSDEVVYPPGSPLPADWPSDDQFGPNAFRYIADLTVTQAGATILQLLPPLGKAWVRNAT